jgi:pyruvate dehydrogenase E1 component beta subunit
VDPAPAVLVAHATLYTLVGELGDHAGPVDLERAAVRRRGADASIVAWGGTLGKALAAAAELEREGIDAEVIDLRVLRPLDEATLLESVRRTRRAVVVDEGWRTGGLSAEIAARIAEGAFYDLDGPVARVCTAEVPIPYPRHLEEAALPQPASIAEAVRRLVKSHG